MEQQLQKLTLAYAPKELANKPRQLKSDITREMIDDYEAETERERTFQPSSMIPVLEQPNFVPAFTEAELNQLQQQIKDYGDEIETNEAEIPLIYETMRQEETFFNNFISDIDSQLPFATGDRKNRLVEDRRRAIDKFRKRSKEAEEAIASIEGRKRGLESRIASMQKAYQENNQNVLANAGESERVRKANQTTLRNMEDEIRVLNQGFSIQQQPDESEEDYLKRIESMKDTKYSVGTQADAEVYNFKMLKKKLSDVLNMPLHLLTNTLKMLDRDGLLYDANKKFPLVKTRIEKVLGLKSSPSDTILYNVIVEALTSVELPEEDITKVDTGDRQVLLKLPVRQLKQLWFDTTGTKTPKAQGKVLTRKEQIVDELLRLQARIPLLSELRTPQKLAKTPRSEEFAEYKTPLSQEQEYQKYLQAEEQFQRSQEKPKRKRRTKAEMAQAQAELDARLSSVIKGKGVEKLVPFGSAMISPAQLRLYNVLRVREPSKHSIRGFPDMKVSDDMVYIVSKLMKGDKPSPMELKALTPTERSVYDSLVFKAKIHKDVPHNADDSIAELKRRLSLLEGVVEAGNNNKDIKKEANHVVRQLVELRAISEQNGRNYLKQF